MRESEEDFAAACRHSLAHGNLLSLRYLVPDIPWQAAKASPARVRQMQAWIARILSLLLRAAETAQHPLSTPQEVMNSAPLFITQVSLYSAALAFEAKIYWLTIVWSTVRPCPSLMLSCIEQLVHLTSDPTVDSRLVYC